MTLIVSMGWMMQVASIPEVPPLTMGFTFGQNHLNRRLRLLNFSLFAFWSKQSIKQSETQNSERRKKRWEREWGWFWYYRDRKSKKNPRKETENNGKSYGGSASPSTTSGTSHRRLLFRPPPPTITTARMSPRWIMWRFSVAEEWRGWAWATRSWEGLTMCCSKRKPGKKKSSLQVSVYNIQLKEEEEYRVNIKCGKDYFSCYESLLLPNHNSLNVSHRSIFFGIPQQRITEKNRLFWFEFKKKS